MINYIEWTHAGIACRVATNHVGNFVGYAEVAKGHPLFGLDYSHEEINDVAVHGGVTFGGEHRDAPGRWWLGWDAGHVGDYQTFAPALGGKRWTEQLAREETEQLANEIVRLASPAPEQELRKKHYLGDGLTAHYDGWQIVLEAERMGGGIHWVALEPKVLAELDAYRTFLRLKQEEIRHAVKQLAREADEAVWSPDELERLKGEGLA